MFGKKKELIEDDGKKKGGLFKKIKIATILFVILSVVFAGLNMGQPETEATDITDISHNGTHWVFTLVIEVDNPNMLSAKLTGVDAKAYIDGAYAGPVTSDKEFSIKQGVNNIAIDFTVEHPAGGNKIRAKGTATIKIMGGISFEKNIDKEKFIV